jgi:hypothetical protein
VEDISFPNTDMDGNNRIAGSSIDIGPYEFSISGPTGAFPWELFYPAFKKNDFNR